MSGTYYPVNSFDAEALQEDINSRPRWPGFNHQEKANDAASKEVSA